MHVISMTARASSLDPVINVGSKGNMDFPCAWPDPKIVDTVFKYLFPESLIISWAFASLQNTYYIALSACSSGYTHVTRKITDPIIAISYTGSSPKNFDPLSVRLYCFQIHVTWKLASKFALHPDSFISVTANRMIFATYIHFCITFSTARELHVQGMLHCGREVYRISSHT
jgi:hypothetical protein